MVHTGNKRSPYRRKKKMKRLAMKSAIINLLTLLLAGLMIAVALCGFTETGRCEDTADSAGTLNITIIDLQPQKGGVVIVALFHGEEGWLELDKAFDKQSLTVTQDTVVVTFADIPYASSYAVQVLHDKNENGKFDMRWFPFPKPKEGAGISNNAVRRGKPKYEQARFPVAQPVTDIRIPMHY